MRPLRVCACVHEDRVTSLRVEWKSDKAKGWLRVHWRRVALLSSQSPTIPGTARRTATSAPCALHFLPFFVSLLRPCLPDS